MRKDLDKTVATVPARGQDSAARGRPGAVTMLPERLLQVVAQRRQTGALPQRCYFWWDPGVATPQESPR